MTGLQFTAALVNSLVWPAVVVFAAFLMRKELRVAFRRMLRLEFPGGAIDFTQLEPVQEVLAATTGDAGGTADGPDVRPLTQEFSTLAGLAEWAPPQAIVYAWGLLESQLNMTSDRIGANQPHGWPQVALSLKRLDNWPLLAPAIAELSRLREYTVKTDSAPSTADAIRYISLAQDLVIALRNARLSGGGGEDHEGDDDGGDVK